MIGFSTVEVHYKMRNRLVEDALFMVQESWCIGLGTIISYHIISYHLFSFRKSVQDYIIHMDLKIVIFVGIKG